MSNEIKSIIESSLELEVRDRCQKFINKLLNEINFNRDFSDYTSDSFKLQLFRFDSTIGDTLEVMLFQNIITQLYYCHLIDEICCSLRSPSNGTNEDGRYFEKFVIDAIKNQPNGVNVDSTQFKHTDAILEYDNEKYILEVKLGSTSTKEQVNGYKKSTGIKKSLSVNGDEDNNVKFCIPDMFIYTNEYAKAFVQMLLIDNTIKTFNEGLVNLSMEILKLESLGVENNE